MAAKNHAVIVNGLLVWIKPIDLKSQRTWFYHSVRQFVNALMANQSCADDDAPQLMEVLTNIDELHHLRAMESDQESDDADGR